MFWFFRNKEEEKITEQEADSPFICFTVRNLFLVPVGILLCRRDPYGYLEFCNFKERKKTTPSSVLSSTYLEVFSEFEQKKHKLTKLAY